MSEALRIFSPVDGSLYAERPQSGPDEARAAVARAPEAQGDWRRMPLAARCEILERAVDRFVTEREAIAEELAWLMGRPVAQGGGEVGGFEERARTMLPLAPRALAAIQPGEKAGLRRCIRREPLGVVLTIAPWNFPYMTAVNSVWPALAAGNCVLLKPASQTAPTGERMARILTEAGLPDGVFQCLPMTHEAVATAVQAEAVGFVCFTGSVAGGRAVQRAVAEAEGFPGTGLELGGKDPAYVRADADIAAAAAGLADGALVNSGQSCCSVERVYVHRSVYTRFLETLVAEARRLRLGNPLERKTTLGPMVSAGAAETVRAQIRDAIGAGARALIEPGEFPADTGSGAYLAPQILVDVDHRMRVMTEETFGPVAGVMPVDDDDQAVAPMNDSEVGLSASIWTRAAAAAEAIGGRLETGPVFMNRSDYLDPELAWTGVRHSGRGCTLSVVGYEQLTCPKSFHLKLP